MLARAPAVSGSFYPESPEKLKKQISNFAKGVKVSPKKCVGLVAPHAGYEFCGRTAALAYKSVTDGFDTIVLLGPNHYGLGVGVSTTTESWSTPLGIVEADRKFIEKIRGKLIMDDRLPHLKEHSIEVQLPWLQYFFKGFKIVPISINPIYYDIKTARDIGESIANAAKSLGRKALLVASSDFTHYGAAYAYEPFAGEPEDIIIRKIKEADKQAIDLILDLKPDELIRLCDEKRLTICGYGGIAAMLHAAKILGAGHGELIDYSTSYDISQDINAIVGYAGIIIY